MTAATETNERTYPAPAVNLETEAYWAAANEGKLLMKKCNGCGKTHFFPRAICPYCLATHVCNFGLWITVEIAHRDGTESKAVVGGVATFFVVYLPMPNCLINSEACLGFAPHPMVC